MTTPTHRVDLYAHIHKALRLAMSEEMERDPSVFICGEEVGQYQGTFRESEVMARFAKEYGYANVEIETFPTQGRNWFTSQAELWMVEPESRKLYDVYDVAIAIAGKSPAAFASAFQSFPSDFM